MPILAIGEFKARSADESGFVRGQAVTFTYVPWYLALWFGCAALVAAIARLFWRARRSYSKGRYLVLIPGVVGIAMLVFLEFGYLTWLVTPSLGTLTVVFVIWRLLRVRSRVLGAFLAAAAGMAVLLATLMVVYWKLDARFDWGDLFTVLVFGGNVGGPVAGIRLALRDRVTWKRLMAGLGIGFVITLGFHAIEATRYEYFSFGDLWPDVLVPFAIGGCIFAVFARWNAWARDVATGNMFRKPTPGE